MVSRNVLLDMLLSDSSSDDNSACTHMYIFLGRSAIEGCLNWRGNDASDSCSSSSDPELQANNDDVVVGEYDESLSYSSGYEGEDSSADEVDVNSSGRLRLIRNSDGKVEGEVNAVAERRARIAAAALVPANSRKEKEVRQKRRNRLKKKKGEDANLDKASLSTKHPAKKKLKFED
ncbi:hypothetical protein C3L33_18619, partial [Rhododendron williamsianum]